MTRTLKKNVAALAVLVYACTQVVFAHAVESNMWAERRQAFEKPLKNNSSAVLLADLPASSSIETSFNRPWINPPAFHAALKPGGSTNDDVAGVIRLAARHGFVREVYRSPVKGAPLVVHVQDVHEVEEAQKNIAGVLQSLNEEGVKLVGLEGAAGPFSLEPYRAYDKNTRRTIAAWLLKQGYIGGAEWAAITADNPPLLWGVEQNSLYEKNISAYVRSAGLTSRLEKEIARLDAACGRLKEAAFSPALKEFDRHSSAYRSQREGIGAYLSYLETGLTGDPRLPNVRLLRDALGLERTLDFKAVERERLDFLTRLTSRLDKNAIAELLRVSRAFQAGDVGYAGYDAYLTSLSSSAGVRANDFPRLNAYRAYQRLAEAIDHSVLFSEMAKLEDQKRESLAHGRVERRLLDTSRDISVLEKLAAHTLTTDDWTFLDPRHPEIAGLADTLLDIAAGEKCAVDLAPVKDFSNRLEAFEDFYRSAVARNRTMVENLLGEMKRTGTRRAVLVTGGFHTQGISDLLKEKKISYVVVTPKLSAAPESQHYLDVFTREPLPIERLFASDAIDLIAPRITAAALPSVGVGLRQKTAHMFSAFIGAASLVNATETDTQKIAEALRTAERNADGFPSIKGFRAEVEPGMENPGVHRVLRVSAGGGSREKTYRLLCSKDLDISKVQLRQKGLVDGDAVPGGQIDLDDGWRAQVYDVPSLRASLVRPFRHLRNFFAGRDSMSDRDSLHIEFKMPALEWLGFVALPTAVLVAARSADALAWIGLVGTAAALILPLTHLFMDWRDSELTRRQTFARFAIRLVVAAALTAVYLVPVLASMQWGKGTSDIAITIGSGLHMYFHSLWNFWARRRGLPTLSLTQPPATGPPPESPLVAEQRRLNQEVLSQLSLTEEMFLKLTKAQDAFELEAIREYPQLALHIFSLRSQQRFSQAVLYFARKFRRGDPASVLPRAIAFAVNQYYGDLIGINLRYPRGTQGSQAERTWRTLVLNHFSVFGAAHWFEFWDDSYAFINQEISGARVRSFEDGTSAPRDYENELMQLMVARAFVAPEPVLFNEQIGSDAALMKMVRRVVAATKTELSVVWCHPFTEERQLIGHRVPLEGKDQLVFGYGELTRRIREAQKEWDAAEKEKRVARKHILMLKNVEALEPDVRTQLQEILRIGELSHPELGVIRLPKNFQIMMTKREGANIEDDSFYDRVIVKTVFAPAAYRRPEINVAPLVPQLRVREGRKFLSLDDQNEIPLSADLFRQWPAYNLEEEIYKKTGLVLDDDTLRMLTAMEKTVRERKTILQIEGPTGVGKTFTARAYARLRGSAFLANPVSEGSDLGDLIGGFEQDEKSLFRFNGWTAFKQRLEEGGVVALSELNTLIDQDEKASLAWFLVQIAEAEPDIDGYKTIRLTEVPVSEGQEVPTIRIHPNALIVVDVNPQGVQPASGGAASTGYQARGSFPDIFTSQVPALKVGAFITGTAGSASGDREKLVRYAEMYLRYGGALDNGASLPGILGSAQVAVVAGSIAEIFRQIAEVNLASNNPTVLSPRELKRICDDVLFDLTRNRSWQEAVIDACRRHLVDGCADAADREKRRRALMKKIDPMNYSLKPALFSIPRLSPSLDSFFTDQVLTKGRPVNIQISHATYLAPEFEELTSKHPNVDLKVIPVTSEMDRFMLEGGLVPTGEGNGMKFGPGILGRLAEQARLNPEREIVYVLENAQNLTAETAVALNEVLQDRKLYQKGRDTRVAMPANAHLILISRDSLNWSPAEKSRYVHLWYDQNAEVAPAPSPPATAAEAIISLLPPIRSLGVAALAANPMGALIGTGANFAASLTPDLQPHASPPSLPARWLLDQARTILNPALLARQVPYRLQGLYCWRIVEGLMLFQSALAADPLFSSRQSNRRSVRFFRLLAARITSFDQDELNDDTLRKLAASVFRDVLASGFSKDKKNIFSAQFTDVLQRLEQDHVRWEENRVDSTDRNRSEKIAQLSAVLRVSAPGTAFKDAAYLWDAVIKAPSSMGTWEPFDRGDIAPGHILQVQRITLPGQRAWRQFFDRLPAGSEGVAVNTIIAAAVVFAVGTLLRGGEAGLFLSLVLAITFIGPNVLFAVAAYFHWISNTPLSPLSKWTGPQWRTSPLPNYIVYISGALSIGVVIFSFGWSLESFILILGVFVWNVFAASNKTLSSFVNPAIRTFIGNIADRILPAEKTYLFVRNDGSLIDLYKGGHDAPPLSSLDRVQVFRDLYDIGSTLTWIRNQLSDAADAATKADRASIWMAIAGRLFYRGDFRNQLSDAADAATKADRASIWMAIAGRLFYRGDLPWGSYLPASSFPVGSILRREGPGEFPPAETPSGTTIQSIRLRENLFFLTISERAAVDLVTGRKKFLRDMGAAKVLRLPDTPLKRRTVQRFRREYGNKPFVFVRDSHGKILLNFDGLMIPTGHHLVDGADVPSAGENGEPVRLRLDQIRHPFKRGNAALEEKDFLMETKHLEDVEGSVLEAFRDGWAVDMEGKPGTGKTSIARDVALLLGLRRTVFQMHGERELADWIGSYREDSHGRIVLTSSPMVGAAGRKHFRHVLLDYIANGGLFVADEGAIGEKGQDLLNWLSPVVQGHKKIFIEEFPGHTIELDVHPDFRLIITNNSPEDTQSRQVLKNEIAANLHFIRVEEDDAAPELERLFTYFLGDGLNLSKAATHRLAGILSSVHHKLKPLIGTAVGKDDKDRHYISKREIRRVAAQLREHLKNHPGDADFGLYKSMRIVYEAMFPHPAERSEVRRVIENPYSSLTTGWAEGFSQRLDSEVAGAFGAAYTRQEAWVAYVTERLFQQDEPVLYIAETGARAAAALRRAADARGAEIVPIDATPEHSELEILGGLFPIFGAREEGGRRSKFVRGAITRHLATEGELQALEADAKRKKPKEVVVWIRNIDQWSEDIRTALNGFLEDGYIDLEVDEGNVVRFFKPPHIRFVAEVTSDTSEDFSSAFFNRWIKVGVSRESVIGERTKARNDEVEFLVASDVKNAFDRGERRESIDVDAIRAERRQELIQKKWFKELPDETGMERVLRVSYGLDFQEALYLSTVCAALLDMDANHRWSEGGDYHIGPDLFYAVAEAIVLAKKENGDWQKLLHDFARAGYDPRAHPAQAPPTGGDQRRLWEDYQAISRELFSTELRRLVDVRFRRNTRGASLSDQQRFHDIVGKILNIPAGWTPRSDFHYDPQTGVLISIGDMPVRTSEGAKAPLAVPAHDRLSPTEEVMTVLESMTRASSLSRVIAIAGETGAAKTTVAAFFAAITGRRFYKYQTHAGSEATDLTIDVDQLDDATFRKRVKDFYAEVRKGNVVIDIDEANISPRLLWVLEPFLRGESEVHPIFPEEPSFFIPEGVVIVLTYNPARYTGRHDVPRRIEEKTIVVWMDRPDPSSRTSIIAGFYGAWDPTLWTNAARLTSSGSAVRREETAAPAEPRETMLVDAEREKPRKAPEGIPEEPSPEIRSRKGSDRRMIKGEDTFDFNAPLTPPVNPTFPHQRPKAYGVFAPELYPYTRYEAFDVYDAAHEEWRRSTSPSAPIAVPERGPEELERMKRDLRGTEDVFEGLYKMNLSDGRWHALPSAGAAATILDLRVEDENGRPIPARLQAGRDAADNLYVMAEPGSTNGRVVVHYTMSVSSFYFGHRVQAGLPFQFPSSIPAEVEKALRRMGVSRQETDFREALYKIAGYFRNFSLDENGISNDHGSLYLDIVMSRCGVCRQRAFAFARTLQAIGMDVRYIESDIHAYAEVHVPGTGWVRFDLGGGGDPMNMDLSPLAHARHNPREADDLPIPQNYRKNQKAFEERMKAAMKAQGLRPPTSERANSSSEQNPGGENESSEFRDSETKRISSELGRLNIKIGEDVELTGEIAAMFKKGSGETESVFERMIRALRSRMKTRKKAVRTGFEVNPIDFMLKKARVFFRRIRSQKLQTVAVSVVLDFSGSMWTYKKELSYAVAAVGRNFWRIREEHPQHFHYDLSFYQDNIGDPVVGMNDRFSEKQNEQRLKSMADKISPQAGNDMEVALKRKHSDFLASNEARSAKVKYLIVFSDGVDRAISNQTFTPSFAALMEKYRASGIDVIAIGFGAGAREVQAFKGRPGLHYVQIYQDRPYDIADAIAKIAEHKLTGAGFLPEGNINRVLGITYGKEETAGAHGFWEILGLTNLRGIGFLEGLVTGLASLAALSALMPDALPVTALDAGLFVLRLALIVLIPFLSYRALIKTHELFGVLRRDPSTGKIERVFGDAVLARDAAWTAMSSFWGFPFFILAALVPGWIPALVLIALGLAVAGGVHAWRNGRADATPSHELSASFLGGPAQAQTVTLSQFNLSAAVVRDNALQNRVSAANVRRQLEAALASERKADDKASDEVVHLARMLAAPSSGASGDEIFARLARLRIRNLFLLDELKRRYGMTLDEPAFNAGRPRTETEKAEADVRFVSMFLREGEGPLRSGVNAFNRAMGLEEGNSRLRSSLAAHKTSVVELSDSIVEGRRSTEVDRGIVNRLLALARSPDDGAQPLVPLVVPSPISMADLIRRLARIDPRLSALRNRLLIFSKAELRESNDERLSPALLARQLRSHALTVENGLDLFILNRSEWSDPDRALLIALLVILTPDLVVDATARAGEDLKRLVYLRLQA